MADQLRYRFADFILSPGQRTLRLHDRSIPLIPKYFDLLLLLIRRRHEAVSKQTIFNEVWADVVVSDGALSQAVRTLRRTLGDDVREPRFIRTVSRHGYQFIWATVAEEPDDRPTRGEEEGQPPAPTDAVAPLVQQLLAADDPAEARDLAEQLHAIGTRNALDQLTAQPHHASAIAMMRDARWSVPEADAVPLLGDAEAPGAILALVRLRLRDVRRVVGRRWAGAAMSGAVGGMVAGLCGAAALIAAPGSRAHPQSAMALAAIGAVAGGIGAGGIAAGLIVAEVLARSHRALALVLCGALAGGATAGLGSIILRALLLGLFGLSLAYPGGWLEGVVLGGAAGLGYSLATRRFTGMAAPRAGSRVMRAIAVGTVCAAAAFALAVAGRSLVGGLIHDIARSSQDAELGLAPLGRFIGEPDFGARTERLLSAFEGAVFGISLAFGLMRRPRVE